MKSGNKDNNGDLADILQTSGHTDLSSVRSAPESDPVREGLPALLVRLFRFAATLCQDETLTNELVRKTCLRALQKSQEFEPGEHLDRWCFSIMTSIWQSEFCAEQGHSRHDLKQDNTPPNNNERDDGR